MKRFLICSIMMGGIAFAQTPPPYLQISQQPLPSVTQAFANYTGTAGLTTYYYAIVARYSVGNAAINSWITVNNIGTGGSVAIGWSAPASPSTYTLAYDVIRLTSPQFPANGTCTNCLVAGNTTALTATDSLGGLAGYSLNTYSQPSVVTIATDNQDYSANALVLGSRNNITVIPQLATSVSSPFLFSDSAGVIHVGSGGGVSGVTAVTASAPLASSGGATPNISVTGILPIANGGTGTASPSLVAGTNVTITGSFPNQTINSTGGGGGSAFSGITSGTNTTAVMVVGTGGSLGISGSGTIAATTATNLAAYPTLCSGGQFAQGLSSGSNNCATPSGSISGLTTSVIPKAASATTISNSSITDNGTTVSTTEPFNSTSSISAGSSPPAVTGTGVLGLGESTGQGCVAAADCLIADSTTHQLLLSDNNGTPSGIVTLAGTQTLSNKTLIAPALGTPVSGNSSNLTNLPIVLTTTGTSGASTYTQSSNTLNIPNYATGSSPIRSFGGGFLNGGSNLTSSTFSLPVTTAVACTIISWDISINATDAGTATIKFLKIATGTASPGAANSINTSGVSLSAGTHVTSTTLTDFTTTAVAAQDVIAVELTAVSGTVTGLTGTIKCQ